jgi:DNA-binding NtrC family response regulator
MGKPVFELDKRSRDILMDIKWRGNVRQLEGFMRVLVQSGHQEVTEPPSGEEGDSDGDGAGMMLAEKVKRQTERFERTEIEKSLRLFKGSRKKAAEHLGMSYRTLLYRMKKYKLRDRF